MGEVMVKLIKILKWGGGVILVAFVALVVVRMFVLDAKEKTAVEVAKIHATKLTIEDVMGKNLPPAPGAQGDSTVQGVDINKNGIRDDVELAIFREYPNSAKIRAVLLQYALALQMEVTQKVVNRETVTAAIQEKARASSCIGKPFSSLGSVEFLRKIDSLRFFIEKLQFNTTMRSQAEENFYEKLGSYNSLEKKCDIDISTLAN